MNRSAQVLALLDRLARIVAAMAQETALHDQMFDLVADIEALGLAIERDEPTGSL